MHAVVWETLWKDFGKYFNLFACALGKHCCQLVRVKNGFRKFLEGVHEEKVHPCMGAVETAERVHSGYELLSW